MTLSIGKWVDHIDDRVFLQKGFNIFHSTELQTETLLEKTDDQYDSPILFIYLFICFDESNKIIQTNLLRQ